MLSSGGLLPLLLNQGSGIRDLLSNRGFIGRGI